MLVGMSHDPLVLDGQPLTLQDVESVARDGREVLVGSAATPR